MFTMRQNPGVSGAIYDSSSHFCQLGTVQSRTPPAVWNSNDVVPFISNADHHLEKGEIRYLGMKD